MPLPLPQPEEESLSLSEVRKLVSLLAAVAANAGDHSAKKCQLLEGLCQMVGATKWMWALRAGGSAGEEARFVGWLHDGFSPDELYMLSSSAAHSTSRDLDAPINAEAHSTQAMTTYRLEDLPLDKHWRESEGGQLAIQAGVGDFISSRLPIQGNKSSVVAVYRPPGAERFTARDRLLVHVVVSEVGWLHTIGWPEEEQVAAMSTLPPSQMSVLNLMVQGYTRKEVAEHSQLTIHTVNTYAKNVFKHFNVKSQAELMRRFLHRKKISCSQDP